MSLFVVCFTFFTFFFFFFFFNDTATTEIYTLSLHDALPISIGKRHMADLAHGGEPDVVPEGRRDRVSAAARRRDLGRLREAFRDGRRPLRRPAHGAVQDPRGDGTGRLSSRRAAHHRHPERAAAVQGRSCRRDRELVRPGAGEGHGALTSPNGRRRP